MHRVRARGAMDVAAVVVGKAATLGTWAVRDVVMVGLARTWPGSCPPYTSSNRPNPNGSGPTTKASAPCCRRVLRRVRYAILVPGGESTNQMPPRRSPLALPGAASPWNVYSR
jgi:hypothetical protein